MKGKNKDQCQNLQQQHQQTPQKQLQQQIPTQLSFPDITSVDQTKLCPRFTSILNRADGVGVGIEEMDSLQMEIESMLVSVMQRNRLLKVETMILDNDKSDSLMINTGSSLNKTLSFGASSSSNATAASSNANESKQFNKKFKSFSGKPTNASFLKTNTVLNETPPIVRNEIPDIFWQSVEPYCADITDEDIKLLENQIEQCDRYSSFSKIGPLGRHYSLQWAEQDMNHQIREGSRFIDLDTKVTPGKRKLGAQCPTPRKANVLLNESLNKLNKNGSSSATDLNYGPLTQRLISALIEQNLMTPFDNEMADYLDKIGPPESTYLSPKTMAKKFSFSTSHTNNIERKLKKTLIEQGLLELDENEKIDLSCDENSNSVTDMASTAAAVSMNHDSTDEIANEIMNVQNELKLVSQQCKQTLLHLVDISKQNLVKQEIKKKISAIDGEIVDLFEKFQCARLAKKPLFKKDKEKAQKLIRDRENLNIQLKNYKY